MLLLFAVIGIWYWERKDMKNKRHLIYLVKCRKRDIYKALDNLKQHKRPTDILKYYSFSDCIDVLKFYDLIIDGKYNQAKQRLTYLAKECSLIPSDIWKIMSEWDKNETTF